MWGLGEPQTGRASASVAIGERGESTRGEGVRSGVRLHLNLKSRGQGSSWVCFLVSWKGIESLHSLLAPCKELGAQSKVTLNDNFQKRTTS